jgi:hypothetical protein
MVKRVPAEQTQTVTADTVLTVSKEMGVRKPKQFLWPGSLTLRLGLSAQVPDTRRRPNRPWGTCYMPISYSHSGYSDKCDNCHTDASQL